MKQRKWHRIYLHIGPLRIQAAMAVILGQSAIDRFGSVELSGVVGMLQTSMC